MCALEPFCTKQSIFFSHNALKRGPTNVTDIPLRISNLLKKYGLIIDVEAIFTY
jgi:hypothetical protein